MAEWRVVGKLLPDGEGGFDVDVVVTGETVARAKTSSVKVAPPTDEALSASVDEAMSAMGDELALYASQMVALMAAENKGGKVALSRAYREVYLPVVNLAKGVGQEAAVFGLSQAVSRGKPNVNYAKKAAASYSAAPRPSMEYTDRYEMVGD